MVIRINITMPEEFLEQVDRAARAEHRGRSELIREALRSYLSSANRGNTVTGASRPASVTEKPAAAGSAAGGSLADRLRDLFAAEKDVSLAYLFGSRASGAAGPMSDTDVAVLVDAGVDLADLETRRLELAASIGGHLAERKVDVVMLNTAPSGLQFQVVKEGILVYTREDDLQPVFEGGVIMRHLGFARVEDGYAKQLAARIARGNMIDK